MVEVGQDATIYRKQDETVRFTIPEAVAGWAFEYTIRALDNTGSALVTIVTAAMTIASGASSSTVDVPLATTDTDLEEGRYAHALWRTGAGTTKPVALGELLVKDSSHTT
jgi:hypothetical protein